jgi:3-carboxy-cis,cis-muconate cycloisomerase
MSDLFWPGEHRAGQLFSASSFLDAMVAVEAAWLSALASTGIAPPEAGQVWATAAAGADDVHELAVAAEAGGNPVIPLVARLRAQLRDPHPIAARWLHRGLTSQDVVDTALILCGRAVLDQVQRDLTAQVRALADLAVQHRGTVMAGRTLGQFAVPITFGVKAASWLQGILDAADRVGQAQAALRCQFGGAAGTMASATSLAEQAGLPDPAAAAVAAAHNAAVRLGFTAEAQAAPPWHTNRGPITLTGDALVSCCDAWGRIANDVITLSRPEIAELSEPSGAGRGGSSTMPQKQNPVLSTLIRRTALSAPLLAAQLHASAADTGDERPTGAWHAEWAALQSLSRRTVAAGSQLTELVTGLQVDAAQMRTTLDAAGPAVLAERLVPVLAELTDASGTPLGPDGARKLVLDAGTPGAAAPGAPEQLRAVLAAAGLERLLDPTQYLGTAQPTIDSVLARADEYLKDR